MTTSESTTPLVEMLRWDNGQLAHYLDERNTAARLVRIALQWLHDGLIEQGWTGVKNPDELVEFVLDEFFLLLVGETLVAFSINECWFLTGKVINEEFVAPIGQPAHISDVTAALEHIGQLAGCSRLMLGTRANPRQEALARLFQQTGAKLSTIELTKEIAHVQGYQESVQGSS